jgi:hypothetical protein
VAPANVETGGGCDVTRRAVPVDDDRNPELPLLENTLVANRADVPHRAQYQVMSARSVRHVRRR